ncbi:biopolymer transporter ExbD [Microvirga sp. SRT01]|uniref:Biopolymer transporter ExbD n=1 Tax=Sphingomonas longa TaxID=2778730 RepID=A0ABS2D6B4_9SPHN|nr:MULTISPECIES: biopolymer transporter ExbD [Alphaproteobacteria]MBM6576461.1 biopolymer transporter ExbD [Sphingomonas sp. BT552]MBR7709507.1 biopolymer transporter ExbD [Microvirga sp. SRT01]
MSRSRSFASPYASARGATASGIGEPISGLNITPLIDVMLVLLVMMIMILPTTLHKVTIDLPAPGGTTEPRIEHRLDLSRSGVAVLDGVATSDTALPARLAVLKADPKALLVMNTDPEARYERFDQVLAVVKRAGITRLGFVGNERMVE